jgi:hypothetical protein
MIIDNPWVGYLQRSYRTIKASLLNTLKATVPEITDFSESHILIVIISMFAGLVEQLNYYIDNLAQESFLGTARKFSSVVKLVQILDYRVKASYPASVDLYFTYVDDQGAPVIITEEGVIPSGTSVKTVNGVNFITLLSIIVPVGASFGVVPAKQWELQNGITIGQSDGVTAGQKFSLPINYARGSIEITINGIDWNPKGTLARSLPGDKDFIEDVDENGIPYIKFGNNLNGAIPGHYNIVTNFYTTDGSSGNTISSNTINQIDTSGLTLPNPSVNLLVTNQISPSAGSDIETTDDIRINAPLTIRTLLRAVTKQDYIDLTSQSDGVAKANVIANCGKNLQVYIAPKGGGIASSGLLDDTGAYIESVKTITTHIDMNAAGITPVVVKAKIQARFRADKVQCKIDCDTALGNAFSFDNQEINGRVAVSDVYALLDNLARVDTVELTDLYTLPYPFPLVDNFALNWTRQTMPGSNDKNIWRLIFAGANFRLYKNGAFLDTININDLYTDPTNTLQFRINNAMYSLSQIWEFTTYPYNKTIQMDDNTIPVITAVQTTFIEVS